MKVESISATEAHKKLKEISNKLSAYDFGPKFVLVSHQDGTHQLLANAFLLTYGEWYLVFTEHNGDHFFHKEDINHILELMPVSLMETVKGFKPRMTPEQIRKEIEEGKKLLADAKKKWKNGKKKKK